MSTYRIKRIVLVISMMLLLILSQTSNVAAANDQGFEYGVEVGNRFDYDVEVTYHNATLDLDIVDQMYVIIDDLPTIADNITYLSQLNFLDFTMYWDNGTIMDDFWKEILHVIPFYLFPIGNWSLLQQLVVEIDPSVEVTQDATIFTVSRPLSEDYNSTYTQMKSDGALAHLHIDWNRLGMEDSLSITLVREGYVVPTSTTTGSTSITTESSITSTSSTTSPTTSSVTTTEPTTSPTPIDVSTLLIIIGGSVVVVLVILIVVIMRKR